MEFALVSNTGLPDDSYISVRAGTTRRQVITSSGRAIRFPKLSMDENPVKVDILQPVGTAFLVLRPGESQYNLSFSCPVDQKPMCAEFVLRESEIKKDGDMVKEDLTKPCNKTAARDAKEYLEMHCIFQVLQALLEVVIKDRPDRPYEYMAEHLISGCRANRSPNNLAKKGLEEHSEGTVKAAAMAGHAMPVEEAPKIAEVSPCSNYKQEEKIANSAKSDGKPAEQLPLQVRKLRGIEELRIDLQGKIQKSSEDGSFKLSLKNAQAKKKASQGAGRQLPTAEEQSKQEVLAAAASVS